MGRRQKKVSVAVAPRPLPNLLTRATLGGEYVRRGGGSDEEVAIAQKGEEGAIRREYKSVDVVQMTAHLRDHLGARDIPRANNPIL